MTDGAVLIVGGTGFIGSHLAERLAAQGARARVASRKGTWPWEATPAGIDFVALDLARTGGGEDEALARALDGVGAVVNLSGMLARPGLAVAAYNDLHAAGTARLAAAVKKLAGSRPVRFVHVSTTGVLGPTGRTPRDESATPAPVTPYEKSKLEGERAALEAHGAGLEVVIIRPGLVCGPRDVHLAPFYRAIAKGRYRTIAGGRALWQPIFVDDVARAIELALDAPGVDGEVFHVAGAERVTVAALAERIAAKLGTRIRHPGLPYAGAMAAGAILEAVCAPFGIDPPLSRARVRTMTENRVYAIERARTQLGFTPQVGLDEGIGRAIDWYRSHGYL